MVAFLTLLTPLVLASIVASAPSSERGIRFRQTLKLPIVPSGLLCKLPIVQNVYCAVKRVDVLSIPTPAGSATGVVSGDAYRFVVKYGSAARWAESKASTAWTLPNGLTDPAGSPLACPQLDVDSSLYSEDCLSLILYVPKTAVNKNLPTLVWIHGGSFTSGSATGPGLDGSKLAVATNSIVAVVQYRLGGFGYLAPNGASNLGTKDVVTALTFLNRVLPSFGGATNKVTLAGQSSGATLIRALLAVPSASSLFQSAILQSDPMDYGFFKPATQQKLNDDLVSYLNCASTDSKCLAALKVQDILDASDNVKWDAGSLDKAASGGEWFRPVQDGSFITSPLSSSATFPKQNKPILVTTVTHEAAYTIYGAYDVPVSPPDYPTAIGYSYTEDSTNKIVTSSYYEVPSTMASKSDADTRSLLEVLGTDGIWRCSAYTFARRWSAAGAKAYVGQFIVGSSYPGNEEVTQCTQAGAVCHQDDIKIVFGTVTNPTAAQSKATAEVQARYAAFMLNGSPNASNYNNWKASTTTSVNAVQLGNNGALAAVGGCTPDFWGAAVLYDYQIYGI